MKITVVKEFTFDAAHYLPEYDGPCRNLHGHTYRLQVGFTDAVNSKTGMVLDFSEIKKEIGKLVHHLDHRLLNHAHELNGFPCEMPTAENMVVWLISWLRKSSFPFADQLSFVRLYETPTSYAEWRKDNASA